MGQSLNCNYQRVTFKKGTAVKRFVFGFTQTEIKSSFTFVCVWSDIRPPTDSLPEEAGMWPFRITLLAEVKSEK